MKKNTPDKLANEALKCKTAEELIDYIQRKLGHGQYIYRGVPQKYTWKGKTDISSSIFIKYRGQKGKPSRLFESDLRPVDIEHDGISRAKQHFLDSMTNREILTSIRHFGGLTTLIDFSRDLMVALFFACQEKLDKNGQLIAYKVHGEIESSKHPYFSKNFIEGGHRPREIEFIEPAITTPTSSARVIAQKSIFVHAPDGFIPPEKCTIFPIHQNLKAEILAYLKRFHHINQKTIYNDMHGFIDLENRIAKARMDAYTGDKLFKQKKYGKAIAEYTRAIDANPDFYEVYYSRGAAKIKLKQFREAIPDFTDAIRLKPDDAEAYYYRGVAKINIENINLEQFREAIPDFTDAIRLNPEHAKTYYYRGVAKIKLEQFKEAIPDFTDAIRLSSDHAESYFFRGVAKIRLERFKEAIPDLTDAIELNPDYADAYFFRGEAKAKSEQLEDAISDFTDAIELKPDDVNIYYNRGVVKAMLGEFKEALEDFIESIRLNPNLGEAYFNSGTMHKILGNHEEAQADFKCAEKLGFKPPKPPNPQKDPKSK